MFLNISTDRIIFIDGDQRVILPYGELEKNLPDFLYNSKFKIQDFKIVILNGPGSFTNLRIATLALNTYNMLHNFTLDFVSVGKIERYNSEFRIQNSKLKRYCVMYIGQKKNFWVVDISSQQSVASSQLIGGVVKLHVDDLKEYVATLGDDWFVDEMVAEGKEMMDSIFGEGEYEMYNFIEDYELRITNYEGNQVKMLEPNYMIDANID